MCPPGPPLETALSVIHISALYYPQIFLVSGFMATSAAKSIIWQVLNFKYSLHTLLRTYSLVNKVKKSLCFWHVSSKFPPYFCSQTYFPIVFSQFILFQVSWLRRRPGQDVPLLLTFGETVYVSDVRFRCGSWHVFTNSESMIFFTKNYLVHLIWTTNQYESRILAKNFCFLTLLINIGKIKVLD